MLPLEIGISRLQLTYRGGLRVSDYLAYRYGVLFVVSAGNQFAHLSTDGMDVVEFEALKDAEKAKIALKASGNSIAQRRILSPANRSTP